MSYKEELASLKAKHAKTEDNEPDPNLPVWHHKGSWLQVLFLLGFWPCVIIGLIILWKTC